MSRLTTEEEAYRAGKAIGAYLYDLGFNTDFELRGSQFLIGFFRIGVTLMGIALRRSVSRKMFEGA